MAALPAAGRPDWRHSYKKIKQSAESAPNHLASLSCICTVRSSTRGGGVAQRLEDWELSMSSRHPFALRSFATATAAVDLAVSAGGLARADTPSRALLTAPIDETRMVTIEGNVRPEVGIGRDLGRLSDSYKFPSLFLQLQRSPEREAALEAYLETVNTRGAPNFHQWFTPQSL